MAYINDEGGKSNYIFLEGAAVSRSKTGIVQLTITDANRQIVTSDQKTYQDLGERLIILNEDPYVAKAVEIYGSLEHDFNNLYLVLEVIAESVSGVHNLYKKPWASEAEIRNFKDTANNYSGNGKYARHAKTTDRKPKNIMSLYEAQIMISNLLNKWIDDRLDA